MTGPEELTAKCQRVYFPVNGYTWSDFVIVNAGIAHLLKDPTWTQLQAFDIGHDEAAEAIKQCEGNVDIVVRDLNFFIEPKIENIEALLVSVSPQLLPLTLTCCMSQLILHQRQDRLCKDRSHHHLGRSSASHPGYA